MIKRLLVADRGEIARRIFATCRAIGIDTVAVYSDADTASAHVREADYAVHLPGNAPSATYLRGDLMVAAARIAHATACADSSAGMMPSSRVSTPKASRASASVTDSYWKRPCSL